MPEEKRGWHPSAGARTAQDLIAECAILNGAFTKLVKEHTFEKDFNYALYERSKEESAENETEMLAMLKENATTVASAIREVKDEDLGVVISMPRGPKTIEQILSYPFWNMSCREGQINYINSLL